MDNNELDYYRHETTCSNTCKSNKTMSGIDSLGSSRDSSMSSLQASAGSSFEESVIRNNTAILGQRSLERSSSEDSTVFISFHIFLFGKYMFFNLYNMLHTVCN